MNTLTQSVTTLSLIAGLAFATGPMFAEPTTTLPAPAPAQASVTALLNSPICPLPAGTKLRSIRISEGLAVVSFSHEFQDNFTGGDTAETNAVNSVLRTLGQFPTIMRVQFLVEGRPLESLGGLLVLSDPLPVIRPGDTPSTPQSGRRWLHRKPNPESKSVSKPVR